MQIFTHRPGCCKLLACYINLHAEGFGTVPVGIRLEKEVNKNNREMNVERRIKQYLKINPDNRK